MSYLPTNTPYQAAPYDPRYYQYGAQRRYVQDWRGYPFPPSTAPARELGGPLFMHGPAEELQANVEVLRAAYARLREQGLTPLSRGTLSFDAQAAWNNIQAAVGGAKAPTGELAHAALLPLIAAQTAKGSLALATPVLRSTGMQQATLPVLRAVTPGGVKTAGLGNLPTYALLGGAALLAVILLKGKKTTNPKRRRR
jgi:hypothetical protein